MDIIAQRMEAITTEVSGERNLSKAAKYFELIPPESRSSATNEELAVLSKIRQSEAKEFGQRGDAF